MNPHNAERVGYAYDKGTGKSPIFVPDCIIGSMIYDCNDQYRLLEWFSKERKNLWNIVNISNNDVGAHHRVDEIPTSNILQELKRRYNNELAIKDYIEMIECEIDAIRYTTVR